MFPLATLLSTKTKIIIAGAFLLAVGGFFWFKDHDSQVASAAVLKLKLKNDSVAFIALRARTDTATEARKLAEIKLETQLSSYDSLRSRIGKTGSRTESTTKIVNDTTYITNNIYQTDTLFLAQADSTILACKVLELSCARENVLKDSIIVNLNHQIGLITKQKVQTTSFFSKLGIGLISGGIGYGIGRLQPR